MATTESLRRAQPDDVVADTTPAPVATGQRLLVRVAPELVALALVAALWPATTGLDSSAGGPGPAFFPQVLLALLACSSLVGVALEAGRSRSGVAGTDPVRAVAGEDEETDLRRALQAAAMVLAYVAATAVMGWVLASTAFALAFLWLAGHRRAWPLLGVAVVAPQVLAYFFVKVVYIALPTGVGVFDTVTVALYRLFGIY